MVTHYNKYIHYYNYDKLPLVMEGDFCEEKKAMTWEIGVQKNFFIDWLPVQAGQLEFNADKRIFTPRNIPRGVNIVMEKPKMSRLWMQADQPWEELCIGGYLTAIYEGGKYRLWYESYDLSAYGIRLGDWTAKLCYAESEDGTDWVKPQLGIVTYKGSKANNIVYDASVAGVYAYHGGTVFRDPSCSSDEQYKLIYTGNVPGEFNFMIRGATSPDGFHWRPLEQTLIEDYLSDSQATCYYDTGLKCYVAYFRLWDLTPWGGWGRRVITRAATPDFRRWPRPETVLALDGPHDHPSHDLYTNAHVKHAEDVHLMFPAQYSREKDTVAVHLAVSRDGIRWHYFGEEPIVAPADDSGQVYAGCGLVPLGENGIGLPYVVYPGTHNYLYPGPNPHAGEYHWAIWERDRLVAVEAPGLGEFSLQPLIHRQNRLVLNLRTGQAGEVRIQLSDEAGKAIQGYSFEDCDPLVGDHPEVAVTWRGNPDLSPTAGKPVVVDFCVRAARIYTFRTETQ